MPRLINADDLHNRMYREAFEKDSNEQRWDSGCWIRYKLFDRVLEETPTIDAVHVVVRCKDCMFYEPREEGGDSYCTRFSADPYEYLPMEDDDFCSRGVKMEKERRK